LSRLQRVHFETDAAEVKANHGPGALAVGRLFFTEDDLGGGPILLELKLAVDSPDSGQATEVAVLAKIGPEPVALQFVEIEVREAGFRLVELGRGGLLGRSGVRGRRRPPLGRHRSAALARARRT